MDKATGTNYDWNVEPRRLNLIFDDKERGVSFPKGKRAVKAWVPYLYMITSFERW
jgi:hypothetical protein